MKLHPCPLQLLHAAVSIVVFQGVWADFSTGEFGVRWQLDCDMVGRDIEAKASPGEQCGGLCVANSGCHVFTWTDHNGGTCWMKGSDWTKFQPGLRGAVCGYIPNRVADNDPRLLQHPSPGGGGSVKGTYWAEQSDPGGCQLPGSVNYQVTDAIALGQEAALGNLAWRSGLCGQVLSVDCGHGPVNAVVASTCNLGSQSCGVDMVGKTWNKVTNYQPKRVTQCSVQLQNVNPISGRSSLCFHRPNTDIGNAYYVAVGVLNTNGRITSSATISGVSGIRGNDGWFQFNSGGQALFTDNAVVSFHFEDGSSSSFQLKDCADGGNVKIFQ